MKKRTERVGKTEEDARSRRAGCLIVIIAMLLGLTGMVTGLVKCVAG